MKILFYATLISVLLISLFGNNSFAQVNKLSRPLNYKTYSWTATGRNPAPHWSDPYIDTLKYDEEGNFLRPDIKKVFTLDSTGQKTGNIKYFSKNTGRLVDEYINFNQEIFHEEYSTLDSQIYVGRKNIYQYDQFNRVTSLITEIYSTEQKKYKKKEKKEYEYVSDSLSSITYSHWEDSDSVWYLFKKWTNLTVAPNIKKNQYEMTDFTSISEQFWLSNNWVDSFNYKMTFTNLNLGYRLSTFKLIDSIYINTQNTVTRFDTNGNQIFTLTQKLIDGNWYGQSGDSVEYIYDGIDLQLIIRWTFNRPYWHNTSGFTRVSKVYYYNFIYFDLVDGIEDETKVATEIILFPQPVNSTMYIHSTFGKLEHCSILNIFGVEMIKFDLNGKTLLDVSTLNPGIYFLNSETDGIRHIKKFSVN